MLRVKSGKRVKSDFTCVVLVFWPALIGIIPNLGQHYNFTRLLDFTRDIYVRMYTFTSYACISIRYVSPRSLNSVRIHVAFYGGEQK